MGVKTIVFFTLVAHTCAEIFNDSSEHSLASDGTSRTKPGASGRSFAVITVYKTQTDEPIDYIDPPDEERHIASFDPNETRRGKRLSSKTTDVPNFYNITGRCNSTAVKCKNTNQSVAVNKLSEEAELFLKSLLVTRVMPSFYIFLFLIGLPLNALALVTFTCKIKAKKPAVIYMSHLACVDLLFTLLLPLKIHYHLNGSHWVFGEGACRVITAAYYCYMYCSILLMMCMSVDRLLAVGLPFASLTWRSTRNSMCVCVLVWLLALAGTVPLLSIKQTFKIENVGITCHDALNHSTTNITQQYVYQFSILSSFYFFLPLVVTLVCYSVIIYVLSVKVGRLATSSSTSDIRRRAVIMTIAVVTEFVACFGPTNGILLYHCVLLALGGTSGEGNASYMVYMFAVCLGSSSVFLDPLLYYYGSSQCRQRIRSVFWWRKTKATSSTHTLTQCSHLSCEYSQARIKV